MRRYHFTFVRVDVIKKANDNKSWWDVEQREHLNALVRIWIGKAIIRKSMQAVQKF
jgi:hypothetical protein